jgi:ATP-dependent Lon protease
MRDFRDAKAMAQTLRDTLKAKSITVSHAESLEMVAKTLGFHDWNVLSAAIQSSRSMTTLPDPSSAPSKTCMTIPVAPMRDIVFFPQLISPIFVGREKTRRALDHAARHGGRIMVLAQRQEQDDDPDFDALYTVGVIADIIHRAELPNGNIRVKVSCSERAIIVRPVASDFLAAEVEPIAETRALDAQAFTLTRELFNTYEGYAKTAAPQSLYRYAREPGVLADVVIQLMEVGVEKTQRILETSDVVTRLETILDWMRTNTPVTAS